MLHQPALTLQVLGPLGLSGQPSEKALGLLRQPKRAAVLAYIMLGAEGDFVSRDTLLSMFWPESTEDNARNALRQSLAFIRSTLGPRVLRASGRHAIGTVPEHLRCDALAFEERLAAGAWTDALALYRSEFLAGFHIDAGPEFGAWVEERRHAYRTRAAQAAWDLAYQAEGVDRPSAAAYWGKKALDLSPFDETRAQRLISLLDRVGDRVGALRTYKGLEAYLKNEFGAEPSPETRRLIDEVRARTAPGETSAASHPNGRRTGSDRRHTSDRRRIVLVWRNPERRQTERRGGERRSGTDRRDLSRI